MMSIKSLPLREILRLHRFIRRLLFTVDWPNGPSVETSTPPEEVEKFLRENHHFEGGRTFSYYYDGEIMNIRRPEGVEDGIQMQFHIRAREKSDDIYEYSAHIEADPDSHPRLHINEEKMRWAKEELEEILSEVS